MAQLVNSVRQVERLRDNKAKNHEYRREKIAYINTNESDQEFVIAFEQIKDREVIVAKLKPGPPNT